MLTGCCLADECDGYGEQRQACNAVGLSAGVCVNTTSAGQSCTKSHGEKMQNVCDEAQGKQQLWCFQAHRSSNVVIVLQENAVNQFMSPPMLPD